MALLQVLLFLLLAALALGWLSRRINVAYPIALVIGGSLLGFVPGLPQLAFDPQFLLVLVLPPILYQAALLTSWRDFKANIRPIGFLAIGLVIVTTLAVGATLKLLVPAMPWAVAFVFGAIVSPPDAVAATAVLSRYSIPHRVVVVLEGESLVNDASGLVLYKFAVAAVMTGVFSLADASVQFALVAAGGTVVGMLIAWVFVQLHRHIGDPFIEVLVSMSIPYVAYIAAESLHLSGVLAVVAAGLFRGRYAPRMVSAEMRILARSAWNILVFLLNSLIFILIGLQLSGILGRLGKHSAGELAVLSLAVSAVAIGVRFLWVYPAARLPRLMGGQTPPRAQVFIVSWCGMRGIVSLAAALALPLETFEGEGFPYRDLLVFLTFVVIFATLVGQGLTLAPLIRRLGLGSEAGLRAEQLRARAAMGRAALAAIDRHVAERGVDPALAARVRAEFDERIPRDGPAGPALPPQAEAARQLRLAAIQAERAELIRVWESNQVSDDVLHHFEEELDHQESRL
jgi:CPA1 family monovalent cation:H+ antiporter